uniref:kelch-like protein 12 n=1 Tax=Styela clava TaxID=7725 RepID=UPI001939622D|nr:kelch-like protein 12 [Styela clava]
MRLREFMCDFKIVVGDCSFPVHRLILAGCSRYFEVMFLRNMTGSDKDYVELKELDKSAVKICLDFIYTAESIIRMSEIEEILRASYVMQLEEFTKLCFEYLEHNLSHESCILTDNLGRDYKNQNIVTLAIQHIKENFESVIPTKMFPQISMERLLSYTSAENQDCRVIWKAITTWVKSNLSDREGQLSTLMENIKVVEFPFDFLFEIIWMEPLVNESSGWAKQLAIEGLFSDLDTLRDHLTLQNCFALKHLAEQYQVINTDGVLCAVKDFFAKHLDEIMNKEEFSNLTQAFLSAILQSSELNCFPETIKWEATIRWVKSEVNRKAILAELMNLISFKKIPLAYIRQNIRQEPLVKESITCREIVIDAMDLHMDEGQVQPIQMRNICVACLDQKTGIIRSYDINENTVKILAEVEMSGTKKIVSINADLYLLNGVNLYRLQQNKTWEKKASMQFKRDWLTKFVPLYEVNLCVQLTSIRKRIYVIKQTTMSRYDPESNSWKENLPGCNLGEGFCVTSSEQCIYAIGGRDNEAKSVRYDTVIGNWSDIAPMQQGRCWASASVVGDDVFVVGGKSAFYFGEALSTAERYNPATNLWTTVAAMTFSRHRFGSCVVNNKLYVIGGARDQNLELDSIEEYNPKITVGRKY